MAWTSETRARAREAQLAKPPSVRQQAIASGAVSYSGRTCKRCGGLQWYVKSKQCVSCSGALQKDPERAAAKRAWADANKEKIQAQRTAQYAADGGLAAVARARRWALANPEKRKIVSMSYKARRRAQEAGGDSTAAIAAWVSAAAKVCYWCGVACPDRYHVDHYMPLSKGGKHAVANLVIACGPCNLRKNAKDPYEFARSLGRLF